jgi:hypothetical protein
MNWIDKCVAEIEWRRHVIGNTARSIELGGTLLRFPGTNQLHENCGVFNQRLSFLNVHGGRVSARLLEKREYSI